MESSTKVTIRNLPEDCVTGDIETILKFLDLDEDTINKCEIFLVHDRDSGVFKGYAYVSFPNEDLCSEAIRKLNGVSFAGDRLRVKKVPQSNSKGSGASRGDRNKNIKNGPRGNREDKLKKPEVNSEHKPAEAAGDRPRLVLKPRTTDSTKLEEMRKLEEEETKRRQARIFGN